MPVASEWPLLWGSDAPVSLGWTAQCAPRTFPSPLISTFIFNGTLQTVSMADDDAVPDLAAPPSDADTSYGVWNPLLTLTLIIASLFIVLLVSVLVIRRVIKMYGATPYTIPYFCVWASKLLPFVKYRNMPIHMSFLPSIRSIENMEVKEDDIFVASFPRSGTTWTQEIVYLVANNANVEKAKATFLSDRFPYLEAPFMGMYKVGKLPAPRLIKTHLHYHLLPAQIHQKNAKIIYVMRNFKDVIVSNYNLFKSFSLPYSGTFSDFCQLFFDDKYIFSPWWRHVKEFWENRHRANILILKYEDMQQDMEGTVRKLSEFLNKPLRDDQIQTIVNHCSFSSMKKNTKVNHKWWDDIRFTQNNDFIRKGKVGDWKNYLSESQSSKADEIVREKLDGTGLSFTDEL